MSDCTNKTEIVVLESNQNHATAKTDDTCPTLPASMGLGGGYVPMIAYVADEIGKNSSVVGGAGCSNIQKPLEHSAQEISKALEINM